jgi:uncharacterized Zn finger protein
MTWSSAEIETMADAYFRVWSAVCPTCNGDVTVQESSGTVVLSAAALGFSCQTCGTTGSRAPALATTPWNEAQMNAIREDYSTNRSASCPGDGSDLEIQEVPTVTGGGLVVRCRRCGLRI